MESPGATDEDRLGYAEALIRSGEWDRAEEQLDLISPTMENFTRYRLEAMIADANEEWEKADSFYEIAVGLTTTTGRHAQQLGLFEADARGFFRRGTDVRRSARLRSEALHREEQPSFSHGAPSASMISPSSR